MPKAWSRPLLGVVLFLGLAAPAQADILTGGVDDAIGDGPVTLGGERRGDVKRVDAEYDEQAGKIKVTFKLRETLPRYYSSTVSASIAQSSAGGKCSYGGVRGDITIQGNFYRYYYNEYNDEIYSNVYVNGVGIAQSTGVGSVDSSRTELTISAQGFPIANLPYQCLTGIRQSESYSSASNEDLVSDFFFAGREPVVEKPTPFIVIPGAPSLTPTTARPGDTLTATTRYENRGKATGVIKVANQTIRRPGQPHTRPAIWDGDFSNRIRDRSLAAGASITQTGTLKLKSNAPPGRWEIYSSWQDTDGVWHDSVSGYFTVEAPRVTPVVTPTPTDDSPEREPAPAPGNPSPSPGTPNPSQGSPTLPVTAPKAPVVRFNVDATARRQSLVRILRSGVRVAGRTPRSGRIAVSLYRGRTKVGSGSIKARKRGSYSATIRLSARGKQVLRRRAGSIVVEARRTRRDTDATTVRVLR